MSKQSINLRLSIERAPLDGRLVHDLHRVHLAVEGAADLEDLPVPALADEAEELEVVQREGRLRSGVTVGERLGWLSSNSSRTEGRRLALRVAEGGGPLHGGPCRRLHRRALARGRLLLSCRQGIGGVVKRAGVKRRGCEEGKYEEERV